MKVAVSATGKTMEAELDPRFGRSAWYLLVDTDNMSYEAVANANTELPSGAGIQSASLVVSSGAEVVLTGNCGPKAAQAFAEAGVPVYTGYAGTVRQVVEAFVQNGSPAAAAGTGPAASTQMPRGGGMGGGRGMGMGGGGRGMGGCGRGMGGGRGMGMGGRGMMGPAEGSGQASSQDLAALKQQARELKQALADIEKKIGDLE